MAIFTQYINNKKNNEFNRLHVKLFKILSELLRFFFSFFFLQWITILLKHDLPYINWFPLPFATVSPFTCFFDICKPQRNNSLPSYIGHCHKNTCMLSLGCKTWKTEIKMGSVVSHFNPVRGKGKSEGKLWCMQNFCYALNNCYVYQGFLVWKYSWTTGFWNFCKFKF